MAAFLQFFDKFHRYVMTLFLEKMTLLLNFLTVVCNLVIQAQCVPEPPPPSTPLPLSVNPPLGALKLCKNVNLPPGKC